MLAAPLLDRRRVRACRGARFPLKVILCPAPGFFGDHATQLAAREISALKVDSAVAARHARFVRGFPEGLPLECKRLRWH